MTFEIASLKNKLEKIFQIPLQTTALYLSLLAFLAVVLKFDTQFLVVQTLRFLVLLVAVGVPSFVQHRQAALKYPFVLNRLITILILFLLIDESAPLWITFVVGLATALVKHFVRLNRLPVFNPAAVGVVLAAANGVFDTWWGVSFSPRITDYWLSSALLLTLPFGMYVAYKYKKLPISLSFFGVLALLSTLMQESVPILMLFEGTVIFFALVMATEPKTSPTQRNQQLIFGVSLAILSSAFIRFHVISPYAFALIILNGIYRGTQWWQMRQRLAAIKQSVPVQKEPVVV